MTFGERLRAARLQRGLTIQQVADTLGLSKSGVAHYEQARVNPPVSIIPAMCRLLGVSADWLLGVSIPTPATERAQAEYRERILDAVCIAFDVRKHDVLGRRRFARLVGARHAAMWMMLEHVGMTLADVGRVFGDRDHSTVCVARQNVENWQSFDAPLWSRAQIALSILGASRAPVVPHEQRSALNPASDTPEGDRASTGRAGASPEPTPLFNSLHEAA